MRFIHEVFVFAPMYVSLFWTIVLILAPGSKNRAKHFLGVFMLASTLVYLSHAAFFSHQFLLYLFFDPIYIFSTLAVYPLFYWYLRLLTTDYQYQYSNLWHLAPALGFAVVVAAIYLMMDDPLSYQQTLLFNSTEPNTVTDPLWRLQKTVYLLTRLSLFVQIIGYLYAGLKLIRNYDLRIKDFYSNLEGRSVDWAKWLMIIFSATAVMSSVANLIGRPFFDENPILLFIPSVVFSILLFTIGYLGHLQNHSVYEFKIDERGGQGFGLELQLNAGSEQHIDANLSILQLKKQLINLFEEKHVYRQNDLKISYISQVLCTNRTYVSKLINDEFGCSFNDFVNRYRVEEAKKLILKDADRRVILEEVAELSGFSSSGSLIRVFKQIEGVTPGVYREKTSQLKKFKSQPV